MAKFLKEKATGDVYPWSESWAKDTEKFEEVEQVVVEVPEPFVVVENGIDPEPEDEKVKGKK